jgi:hypothetical protein
MTITGRTRAISTALAIAAAGALTVASLPAAQAYPPGQNLTVASSSTNVKVGVSVTLTITKAQPGCTVLIDVLGATIPWEGTRTAPGNGRITLTGSFTRAGTYRVRATTQTGGGCTSEIATSNPINVFSAPAAVRNATMRAQSTKARSITVTWGAATANGSPVTQYIVSVFNRLGGGSAIKSATTNGAARSVSIGGLTSGSKVYVSIVAKNAAGNGPASAPRIAVTVR